MALSVVMPALEMAQETGKLVAWLKQEGEPVRKGEMLLEIETDKAVVEIEAAGDGVLAGITASAGDVIPVGQTIAWLVQPGEAPPATSSNAARTGRRSDARPTNAAATSAAAAAAAPASVGAPRMSPKARRLAKERGVDVSRLKGSGPGGEILAEDVEKAATAAPRKGAPYEAAFGGSIAPVTSIGRLMAERTTESWTTVPHFFVSRDVEATALTRERERLIPLIQQSHGVKVTHTDLLVSAVARTLRRWPRLNGSWTADGIALRADVNIALAVALETDVDVAVVAGVIHEADTLPLGEIAARRRDLADRTRAGRLQPSDLAGATFTISNLGMMKVDAFTAIIVPPQAGILAVGAIADRVVPVDGQPGIRPMMTMTLSCDHRVIDGFRAALFLEHLVEALQVRPFPEA
jgi:pyruvate dehydrogenase E2 component (dihydrolipoamide acetyltransferase)